MRRIVASLVAVVSLALTGAACGSDDSPVIEAPATSEVPQRGY